LRTTEFIVNGWRIYPHPIFSAQYLKLVGDVRKAKLADPANYKSKRAAKLLMATDKMAFIDIPADPADAKFRQGGTLGDGYTHWRRGKYLQQYRLFFRYSEKDKIIILAWMNDETTKRAYDSRSDAYRVFARMLGKGHPPDDWATLLTEAQAAPSDLDRDI
jgi:toxin YhaV